MQPTFSELIANLPADDPNAVRAEDELRAHMTDHLVSYKCPSTYEFVDEPVRDDAGKVRRSLLAEDRS